jgi:hypothetical protein
MRVYKYQVFNDLNPFQKTIKINWHPENIIGYRYFDRYNVRIFS